jgi:hypothetical protein
MRRTLTLLCVAPVFALTGAAATQQVELPAVLMAAAKYVADYEAAVSLIVAEESYRQLAQGYDTRARWLKSDLAVLLQEPHGWVSFRDVYEVDGKPVRDRMDRVLALFEKPSPDSLEQARRIAAEGARYDLHPEGLQVTRTINVPMTTLRFFRPAAQVRSTFDLGGTRRADGRTLAIVKFRERAKPRMIQSSDEAAAMGSAWIDVATGRIERTELKFDTATRQYRVASTVIVTFAEVPRIGLWMPVVMEENHDVRSGPTANGVSGRATYANFRQFKVDTSVIRK